MNNMRSWQNFRNRNCKTFEERAREEERLEAVRKLEIDNAIREARLNPVASIVLTKLEWQEIQDAKFAFTPHEIEAFIPVEE